MLTRTSPQAVASFIQLARADYWLNSPCQRLGTGEGFKLLQCGDPTGTGQGNPGYGFGVENAPPDGKFPAGTVAMARAQDPNSNGSQFFIVYKASSLPAPGYTVLGRITSGLDVVKKIADGGAQGGSDGKPLRAVSIVSTDVAPA